MTVVLTAFTVFLLLNLAAGLVRAHRGPTASDRMSAALLFGSTMVAILLVLAELHAQPALRDVALLFVMFAAILSVAFAGMPAGAAGDTDEGSPGESEGGAEPSSRRDDGRKPVR